MSARRSSANRGHASPLTRSLIIFGIASIALLLVLVLILNVPFFLSWIASLSVVTFAAYGYDKRQAAAGGWRTPELALHVLALAGGFLGGWAGRAYFRHKTRHSSFTIVLTISTVIYAFVAYWLYFS